MTIPSIPIKKNFGRFARYLPILEWGQNYTRETFSGDLLAGVIVAIMLVPQSMAYALLAGLPPEVGLYASIVPLILYGLLGTSRSLAVGPVAMVSLLVASVVVPLAGGNPAETLLLAVTLALLVGLIQTLMGILRIGFLVNFLSHPVLSAFTSAAAILIGFSQLKSLLGFKVPRFEYFYETVVYTFSHLPETNLTTLAIGLVGIGILFVFKKWLPSWLELARISPSLKTALSKMGPLVIVIVGILGVMFGRLDALAGVSIVGAVPSGLPPFSLPSFAPEKLLSLLPAAIAISMVGYMESVSVAKSLASKRREKIDPDQELIALGMANLGAAFTGGFPVTGGISRSVVNFSAGARTGMASIVTAGLIVLTLLFLTPIFYYLPQAMLAAIVLVAIFNMVDFGTAMRVWRYNRADGVAWWVTFLAVLGVGVETGILYGVAASILLFIWRTSRPHVAVVGRVGQSEIYRNVLRHEVQTWPELIAIRIDQSLYFANTKFLEDTVLGLVADRPEVKDFVLICTAVNFIDASAIETLESLLEQLRDAGVTFHLAAVKGPVLDQLKQSEFWDHFDESQLHFTTHDALKTLRYVPLDL
ncbi:MAG: SulP family sulfate permease [Cellvibrionaceae bacterium]|jgi:SulP family sulfate permease